MPDLSGNRPGNDKLTDIVINARLTIGPGSHIYLLPGVGIRRICGYLPPS